MLRRFRRLQWRMTWSYLLVTIPAIVLLQACVLVLIGGAFAAFLNSQALAEDQAGALAAIAPQAAPLLENAATDREALGQWLRGTMSSGAHEPRMFPSGTYPAVYLAAVVDAGGRVVADASGTAAPGALLAEQLDPQATQVLRAALDGQTTPQALAIRRPDRTIAAATPIKRGNQVVGAWVVSVAGTPLPTRDEALLILLVLLIPLSILASCWAIGLGALYGWMTSRNLVHRLRQLSLAADAWSAGDFQVLARDSSQDELGYLSRRLNQMAEKLRALVSTRQELATLEERNRLARDLHDSVKQQLFAISMQLASARTLVHGQATANRLLVQAESLTQAAQRELTATIHALRPATLSAGGVEPALRALVAEWSHQHAIAASLQLQLDADLPLPVEQAVFRVAQEALANVARHSAATQVTLDLVAEPFISGADQPAAPAAGAERTVRTAIRLSVADNGRGFDRSANGQHGIGLHSMRERVMACGGTLTVDSRPGAGTRVSARFLH